MEGEKRKILIVDDDNFLLDMYALKFSQNSFEVYTASNGEQALEKLKGGLSPDILLMDVIMPEMNGFEAMEKMNQENLCPICMKVVLSNKRPLLTPNLGGCSNNYNNLKALFHKHPICIMSTQLPRLVLLFPRIIGLSANFIS